MPVNRRRRSALFLPGSNLRAIAKARTLPCDVVVLDLEDAVAPERKDEARAAVVAAVAEGFGDREVVVRANAVDTPQGQLDLGALAGSRVDAVLLPKLSGAAMLAEARAALGDAGPPIWAMIETAAGLLALPEIVAMAARQRLAVLVAGTNDLALDLRCHVGPDRAPLLPALAQIIAAARAGGMAALDGVLNAIDDADRLAAECAQGRAWGFDGKTLIHPAQIDAANAAYGATPDEIAWARSVVTAFTDPSAAGRGAVRLDGAMVERLHLAEAERLLALAD